MKCVVCSKKLSGNKKKYCSAKCYLKIRRPLEKAHYRKYNPYLPNRNCLWCEKSFRPRGDAHVCCTRSCRNQIQNKKAKEQRKFDPSIRQKWGTYGFIIKPKGKIKPTLTDEPMSLQNSKYKNEIEKYLANGGKIKSLPNQINGTTPAVNISNLSGWSVETLFGFGYEITLLDELSSASEVGDAD